MRHIACISTIAFAMMAATISPGLSQSANTQYSGTDDDVDLGADGSDIVIELGGGARYQPEYEGASSYEFSPFPIIRLKFLRLPFYGSINARDKDGLSIGPAFNYIGERKASDDPSLFGLANVDASYEVGARVSYRFFPFRAYVELLGGFGGYEGFTGETGLDFIAEPTSDLTLFAGPRLTFADSNYMNTYFSVPTGTMSPLTPFNASGGIKSVGIEGEARYEFHENWAVIGDASWFRLVGDAGDSPIVAAGSKDQFRVGLGLSYQFSIDLVK